MSWLGTVHVGAATAALIAGAAILFLPKGTKKHRRSGYLYLACLILLNGAALSIYEDSAGEFRIFHYLALLSLATISAGFGFVWFGRQRPSPIITHAYFMSWSYAGLVGAGMGQAAEALGINVLFAILAALCVAAVIIHTRVGPAFALYIEIRDAAH